MAGKGKHLRHYIAYKFVMFSGLLVRRMPARIALFIGARFAVLMYHLVKRRREITMSNLQMAFGGENHRKLKSIAIESYKNLGKSLVEFLRFPLLTRENFWNLVEMQGKENLEQALETSGNAIVFIPHFGNHEMMAPLYSILLQKSTAIAFPLKNPYINEMTNGYRSKFGLEIIRKHQAIRHVLKALRNGYVVGFVADQDGGKEGVFVEFFGQMASCSRGPVAMALKTKAPLLFSIDIRQPDDRHKIIISAPIELEISGNYEKDMICNTAKLMSKLESYIRQYPEQWMWQHNRWKTQPGEGQQKKRNQRRV